MAKPKKRRVLRRNPPPVKGDRRLSLKPRRKVSAKVGLEKGRTGLDEGHQTFAKGLKSRKAIAGSPAFYLAETIARGDSTRSPASEREAASTPRRMVDSMAGVAQDTLRSRAEGSEASAFGMHQADAGSDAMMGLRLELAVAGEDALYEIDQALKRIEVGPTASAKCRVNHPHARLEAIPFARFTVQCQSQLEKQNKLLVSPYR